MPRTRAQENRAIRQEALREQLASQKHVEHVIDTINKINDPTEEITPEYLGRLKFVVETRLKLITKYLPDLKATEHTGQIDSEITKRHRVTFK